MEKLQGTPEIFTENPVKYMYLKNHIQITGETCRSYSLHYSQRIPIIFSGIPCKIDNEIFCTISLNETMFELQGKPVKAITSKINWKYL